MAASHKRLLRFPKQDYVAAKERLGALAEEDGREMWYDERKEMVGFRGESLADLKGFAEKCSYVLKWAESMRMNCDELEMRMVEMDLAKAKIEQAQKFMCLDKSYRSGDINVLKIDLPRETWENEEFWDEVEKAKSGYKIQEKIDRKNGSWKVSGKEPFPKNYARHIYYLVDHWDEVLEMRQRMGPKKPEKAEDEDEDEEKKVEKDEKEKVEEDEKVEEEETEREEEDERKEEKRGKKEKKMTKKRMRQMKREEKKRGKEK